MAFYGDPDVVQTLCRNLQSIARSGTWDAEITVANEIVEPMMLANLDSIFKSLPDKTSTNATMLGVLWCYEIARHLQENLSLANTTGMRSAIVQKYDDKIEEIYSGIRSRRYKIPGAARRGSSSPAGVAYTAPRLTINDKEDGPDNVSDAFQRGLRR